MSHSELLRERREAARILHEYIRDVLHEEDETDISGAYILKDLFDCGECVQHVAQVYLKGIMEPVREREFGMRETVTAAQMRVFEERAEKRELRTRVCSKTGSSCALATVDLSALKDAVLIDVRSRERFNGEHMEGAVNIPLAEYALNPHLAGEDLFKNIVFICDTGKTASIAAEYAIGAGYRKVFYYDSISLSLS